jgi:2-polyprenyl-6-hydroxyphenyl methylase / 3-demethylubiquinone-9 3-methyltransferase
MSHDVDNELYRRIGHAWWDDDVGEFSTIRFFVNPVRCGYFLRAAACEPITTGAHPSLLDVGCGGGFLAEEFARAGYAVTGVDPAPETIDAARAHAETSGLPIDYRVAAGEQLPFDDVSFDAVACCDVLEHVADVDAVVTEIARVLRPGGMFFYDTINRTFESWIAVIKVMQDWRATAFAAPNSHVWSRFITPTELTHTLQRHGLRNRDMRGICAGANPVAAWTAFRHRAQGKITFREMGERLRFREGDDLGVSYMGYATRDE